ncbi:MAG: tetratricopeptide repeat protein [Rhodospirillaceae bacterium]
MTSGPTEQLIVQLRHHLKANPNDGAALQDLSVLLGQSGKLHEALELAGTAVSLLHDSVEAWLNKGNLEARIGKSKDAIRSYLSATKVAPSDARAWYNLGNILALERCGTDSISTLEIAHKLAPTSAPVLASLALAYRKQNRLSDAIHTYELAIDSEPENPHLRSNLAVTHQYQPDVSDELLYEKHKKWFFSQSQVAGGRSEIPTDTQRPLRIGYVSGDFRQHPIGFFLNGVLECHNRDLVDVFCFSDTRALDDMTSALKQNADHWVDSVRFSDDELCRVIRQNGIDILVDLSGHFARNRLTVFAQKAAPVQVTWAGYVGTTGLATMDWLIADKIHAPMGYEAYTTERIIRLSDNYICFTPPSISPDVAPLPFDKNGYITFGCFNNLVKLNAAVLQAWTHVLRALPKSQLILKTADLDQPELCAQINASFESANIDLSRISLKPASDHIGLLRTYGEIDIALDPFPYSGGLTTLEALWMGVPVVTKTGRSFAGRHSTAHLTATGLPDWVANNDSSYIATAIAKASDTESLRELRNNLRQRLSVSALCQHIAFTQKLERAFKHMWDDACAWPSHDRPRVVDIS